MCLRESCACILQDFMCKINQSVSSHIGGAGGHVEKYASVSKCYVLKTSVEYQNEKCQVSPKFNDINKSLEKTSTLIS